MQKQISSTLKNIEPKTFKRDGLKNTPARVAKAQDELYSGYKKTPKEVLTTFDSEGYNGLVILSDIEFFSTCEHHMLPFYGKAHIGYIPDTKIVGISKLARITEIFAKRLQNQERITQQIADSLEKELKPLGVMVVLQGEHFCMKARGVQKNAIMTTSVITGRFEQSESLRNEFLKLAIK